MLAEEREEKEILKAAAISMQKAKMMAAAQDSSDLDLIVAAAAAAAAVKSKAQKDLKDDSNLNRNLNVKDNVNGSPSTTAAAAIDVKNNTNAESAAAGNVKVAVVEAGPSPRAGHSTILIEGRNLENEIDGPPLLLLFGGANHEEGYLRDTFFLSLPASSSSSSSGVDGKAQEEITEIPQSTSLWKKLKLKAGSFTVGKNGKGKEEDHLWDSNESNRKVWDAILGRNRSISENRRSNPDGNSGDQGGEGADEALFEGRYEHSAIYHESHVLAIPASGKNEDGDTQLRKTKREVLVLFGAAQAGPLDDIFSLDIDTQTWQKLSPKGKAPSPRVQRSLAHSKNSGRLFLFGGGGGPGKNEEVKDPATYCLDLKRLFWCKVNAGVLSPLNVSSPCPRLGHSLCLVEASEGDGELMYMFGGFSNEMGMLDDLWTFNTKSYKWTQIRKDQTKGPWPEARCAHTCTSISEGRIVLVGGMYFPSQLRDGEGERGETGVGEAVVYNSVYTFNTYTFTWIKKIVPMIQRLDHTCTYLPSSSLSSTNPSEDNERLLIFGGMNLTEVYGDLLLLSVKEVCTETTLPPLTKEVEVGEMLEEMDDLKLEEGEVEIEGGGVMIEEIFY